MFGVHIHTGTIHVGRGDTHLTRARRTSTLPPTLTSARPPTRVWEVVRTVAEPPSIVVKCGGVVLRVVVCGVVLVVPCVAFFLLCVCVCDLFRFLHL